MPACQKSEWRLRVLNKPISKSPDFGIFRVGLATDEVVVCLFGGALGIGNCEPPRSNKWLGEPGRCEQYPDARFGGLQSSNKALDPQLSPWRRLAGHDRGKPSTPGLGAILAAQPFSVLLGTVVTPYDAEGVELQLPVTDKLRQQHGFAHGGVLAYLGDNALTFAAGLPMGGGVVTAEMKLNYVRPAIGELLIARAASLSAGKTQGIARCDIFIVKDGEEKLCAAAQGMVMRAAPPS